MPKLTDVAAATCSSVLLFGPPKSGKTEAAGKLAEQDFIKDVLWFDLENGSETLKKLSPAAQAKITLIKLPDSRIYPIAIETCLKVVKGGPMEICVEHGKVTCPVCKKEGKPTDTINLNDYNGRKDALVVFDSLTQLSNSGISNITKNKPDDYKLDWDDWGNLGTLMDKFLSQIQAARYNVVCISHELPVEGNDGKEKLVAVAGTRNFSRNSAKYFAHVVYATIVNKSHQLESSTTFSAAVLTGSRTNVDLGKDRKLGLEACFR